MTSAQAKNELDHVIAAALDRGELQPGTATAIIAAVEAIDRAWHVERETIDAALGQFAAGLAEVEATLQQIQPGLVTAMGDMEAFAHELRCQALDRGRSSGN